MFDTTVVMGLEGLAPAMLKGLVYGLGLLVLLWMASEAVTRGLKLTKTRAARALLTADRLPKITNIAESEAEISAEGPEKEPVGAGAPESTRRD